MIPKKWDQLRVNGLEVVVTDVQVDEDEWEVAVTTEPLGMGWNSLRGGVTTIGELGRYVVLEMTNLRGPVGVRWHLEPGETGAPPEVLDKMLRSLEAAT